jgi:GH24 family phage-related lysozyme (muramidase)
MTITQEQADAYLAQDITKYEKSVNATGLKLNQNQFDALVSFTYNCGSGNLKKLITGRSLDQIADAMLSYNKAAGQVLAGLTRRRQAEHDLFCYWQ